jgi:hypothetical protein
LEIVFKKFTKQLRTFCALILFDYLFRDHDQEVHQAGQFFF